MYRTASAVMRSVLNTYPVSRFRSLEERIGIVAFALMLMFAMSHGAAAHEFKIGDIEIGHPWSRVVPQGAKVSAGYLTITNNGSEADRLVSVASPVAGKTELHEMAVDSSGVMTMRPLADGVEIPAGATVELKPGGMHVMFMGVMQWAKEGETFKGTLTFEKAGAVDVEFKAQPMGEGAGHSSHGG